MARLLKRLIVSFKRLICPVLAHDWHFEDIHRDGHCTAVCRRCGRREAALVLTHEHRGVHA